jgi:hypothetical protein
MELSVPVFLSGSRSAWIRIGFGLLKGKKEQKKEGKKSEISYFEMLDFLFFRAEGFSYGLDILYIGLGISKLQSVIRIRIRTETNADPKHWSHRMYRYFV